MSIYSDMLKLEAPAVLRLLAKQIDDGEPTCYALCIVDSDNNVVSVHNNGENTYMLIGALEAEKISLFDSGIE